MADMDIELFKKSINAMIAIGVNQLTEVFISLHQCLNIFCCILIVHIVISQSVDYQ